MKIVRNSKILFGISLLTLATPVWAQDSAPAETPAATPVETAEAPAAPAAEAVEAASAAAAAAADGAIASATSDALPADIDPARFAIAEQIVQVTFPLDESGWVDRLIAAYSEPRVRTMRESEEIKLMLREAPQLRRPLDELVTTVADTTRRIMAENLPGLRHASAIAYARTFDVETLRAIDAFFQTPTGRTYAHNLNELALTAEISAWQSETEEAIGQAITPALENFMQAVRTAAVKNTDENEP